MEQGNPCCHIVCIHPLCISALHDEVECLGETKQEDDVDDGEGEHVSCDHGEDHRNKRTRQLYGSVDVRSEIRTIKCFVPCKEHQIEP